MTNKTKCRIFVAATILFFAAAIILEKAYDYSLSIGNELVDSGGVTFLYVVSGVCFIGGMIYYKNKL